MGYSRSYVKGSLNLSGLNENLNSSILLVETDISVFELIRAEGGMLSRATSHQLRINLAYFP